MSKYSVRRSTNSLFFTSQISTARGEVSQVQKENIASSHLTKPFILKAA